MKKYTPSLLVILVCIVVNTISAESISYQHHVVRAENDSIANPEDVSSINGIISAMYDVISGPAGQRDWERFSSLFKDGATMGAITQSEDGKMRFALMTPEQYKQRNNEYFKRMISGRKNWDAMFFNSEKSRRCRLLIIYELLKMGSQLIVVLTVCNWYMIRIAGGLPILPGIVSVRIIRFLKDC